MNVSISQAMACGLPVIATLHSGFPDQVVEGVTGVLVPEGDWLLLGKVILDFCAHRDAWKVMGYNGRKHVKENYDIDVLIRKQICLYNDLMK